MGPLQDIFETWARGWSAENSPAMFVRERRWLILAISAVVLIPCFWHRRIEAGDLASHVYNAWLAQLVEKGQAPGLYLAKQWDNILFDVALTRAARVVGFAAAQKIVVGVCVLVFFWGVFALVAAITERPPWFLMPCIAMLAYGYSFNMGFMNYYLSLGLACFSLALFCRPRGVGWVIGAFLIPITLLAHPIGFLWLIATLGYIKLRNKLSGWWKVILPLTAFGILVLTNRFMVRHAQEYLADWDRGPFYLYNGTDQLALYGERYYWLAGVVCFLGILFVVADGFARRGDPASWRSFALAFELYALAFCATTLLPENFHVSLYSGWIGFLGSRLTTVSAILSLCFLGFLKPRKLHFVTFAACAVVFFVFLWQDTKWLNRLEANAEEITRPLPMGTRVIPTVWASPGSRVSFIGHVVDRACIGRCFNYANYEPASREFRVRVRPGGSSVATASSDDSEEMESGEHEIQDEDLPLKEIYQCDAGDLTKLCIRDLESGEKNGRIGYKPPAQ
jgi:hypothetical protein